MRTTLALIATLAACQQADGGGRASSHRAPAPTTALPAGIPAPPAAPPPPVTPPKPAITLPPALAERATLLRPIQVDSLTLTPIAALVMPTDEPDVLTLDEGFAAHKIRIRERDDEDVNNLMISNRADKPVFLLAGEVILGGKQDRIIGANTVIPPRTQLAVPVFCVEHGRWDDSSKEFRTAKALAHGRLRGKASFESQSDVWAEVSDKNAKRRTSNGTDTYRIVATQQSDGTLTRSQAAVDAALALVPADDRARMVGYVVALNGEVATVDLFTSPRLFGKLEGKLVRSYLTEAIDIAATPAAVAPSMAKINAFMEDADKAVEEPGYENALGSTMMKKGARTGKAKVHLKGSAAGAPMKPLYETYMSK